MIVTLLDGMAMQPWPRLGGEAISCLPEAKEQSSANTGAESESGVDAGSNQH